MVSPTTSEASFILVNDGEQTSTEQPSVSGQRNQATKHHPFAHDWSSHGTGGKIRIHGRHFVDAYGRVCNLRGVNLSGNCKTPINDDHSTFPANPEAATFVGRPFPLDKAHEHFSRLRRWGFTFIRFLITWESVEHAGPGIYDTEYLEYLHKLLSLLPEYGMVAFVCCHQDVWSRYAGGSGAPAWTMTSVGFDLHALEETGAAWLKGVKGGGHVEEERGLWPCGYQKLAAATMATCFWAGDTFTPKVKVKNHAKEEVSIQTFLQNAFLDMWELVAKTLGDLDGVIGFEIMNEPHRGYVDLPSMHAFDYNTDLHLGPVPTPFQSFMLGAGHPTEVGVWTRSFPMPTRLTGKGVLNSAGKKVWREDGPTQGQCLWEMHGVWGWDKNKNEGVVLRESYFIKDPTTNKKVDWYTDHYFPLLERWVERVRRVSSSEKFVFVEGIPNEFCPPTWTPKHQPSNMVYAPHWYDLNALFQKGFGDFSVNVQGLSRGMFPLKAFYWGQRGARENFSQQISRIANETYGSLGEKPVIIGECGIPMDMNKGEAFKTDNWKWQLRMMDAMLSGLERSLIGFTLWNYNPDNDDAGGDDWNGENFSWFSQKRALVSSLLYHHQTAPTLDNGGRILRSVVRPYAAKTAGIPLRFEYEVNTGDFSYSWMIPHDDKTGPGVAGGPDTSTPPRTGHPELTSSVTEIFLPSYIAQGSKVVVQGLGKSDTSFYDESRQTLYITVEDNTPSKVYDISVVLSPRLRAVFEVNDLWGDFGAHIATGGTLIFAMLVYLISLFL
ncbi:glycoside hydrolase family 5 protein [Irpex rosettiformis]|uniref:Glycoside hydrolase family 5 protein n=1 Tax=Irpex rosettiformis TaxID=378272 RepID=A0ACB8U5L5_9APHY|nr:glycoside hydrolase family 5 protein [Irpex rosettiformis]